MFNTYKEIKLRFFSLHYYEQNARKLTDNNSASCTAQPNNRHKESERKKLIADTHIR